MIINKKNVRKVTLFCVGCACVTAYLLFMIFPGVFSIWNEQTYDRILVQKSKSKYFRPIYNDTIVHIDLNNASLRDLNSYYLNRGHHAQVIRNLAAMNVSSQMYDFIFAGTKDPRQDMQLIDAAQNARNVYFGLVFHMRSSEDPPASVTIDEPTHKLMEQTKWKIMETRGASSFYIGEAPITSFGELANASKDSGYLNIRPDSDGVFRRLPLLTRYGDAFYPSFSLKLTCDFLAVPPEKVSIRPGAIILKEAHLPGSGQRKDIVIPVDKHGNMRINFVGAWGRMKHYAFSDIYFADQDPAELEIWHEELSGKIVLVSDVSAASTHVGKVSIDMDFPLSGIHTNSVHTILTESFLKEVSPLHALLIEVVLLLGVAGLSLHRSALLFTFGSFGIAGGYIGLTVFSAFSQNLLFPVVEPLVVVFFAVIAIHIASAVDNARTHAEMQKAKEIAEKELEIGSSIQAGFFPKYLPDLPGWEVVPYFKSARQVSGDFYDIFDLGNGRLTCVVVADVCDKGVGAALFMALIRSLLRAGLIQGFNGNPASGKQYDADPNRVLKGAVEQVNNYIAKTHEDDGMFATLFAGILDSESAQLTYVNCGHEAPVIIDRATIVTQLKPTGPALGAMPDIEFAVREYRLEKGNMLFAFTDGLTEAENEQQEAFTRQRLLSIVGASHDSAEYLVGHIKNELFAHIAGASQIDDITMFALARKQKNIPD